MFVVLYLFLVDCCFVSVLVVTGCGRWFGLVFGVLLCFIAVVCMLCLVVCLFGGVGVVVVWFGVCGCGGLLLVWFIAIGLVLR